MPIHKSWFQQDSKCYCVDIIRMCVCVCSFIRLVCSVVPYFIVYFPPFTFSRDSRSFFCCSLLKLLKFMLLKRTTKKQHLILNCWCFLFTYIHIFHGIFANWSCEDDVVFSRDVSLFVIIVIISNDNIVELYWWLENYHGAPSTVHTCSASFVISNRI